MLIKVTNKCSMGCSHCMEDSTVKGEHMTYETFLKALDFTARAEKLAWAAGCLPLVLLSGGECTEHPDIVKLIETVFARGMLPFLISNGAWLADDALRAAILRPAHSSDQ
jgi:MoaA/NifB/PqqE/SkfB family radical SAM enzyme